MKNNLNRYKGKSNMSESEITIKTDLANKIIGYLVNRPYKEVHSLVDEFLSIINEDTRRKRENK
jgi:hypothetical protein